MKVLSIIVTPKAEDAKLTIQSLKEQTVHTEIYCIIGKPNKKKLSGQIIGETINDYFRCIDLERYDWIFKSDDDILYPKDFLEVHLKANCDVIGKDIGMLVKVEPFLKFMSGKWNETDLCGSYLSWTFQVNGLKVFKDWIKSPLTYERPYLTIKRVWVIGKLCYNFGFPILSFVEGQIKSTINSSPLFLVSILGYVYAWIRREPKDSIASKLERFIKRRHQRLYRMEELHKK